MPNLNYQRGYRFEKRVRKQLERRGYFVIEARSSKGVADLVALKADEPPKMISCKVRKSLSTRFEEALLIASAEKAGATAIVIWREGAKDTIHSKTLYRPRT